MIAPPFNLIDIGSTGDVPEPWNDYPECVGKILKFEPREADESNDKITFLPYALWSREEDKSFYVYRGLNGTGSSLYRQNYHYVAANFSSLKTRGSPDMANTWFERSGEVKRTTLKCRTLDSVLREQQKKGDKTRYHFLKVDAQGADLDILHGATEYLQAQCMGVQCELFTIPLYEGIQLLEYAVEWMAQQGFELAIKREPHGTFLSQHDCIFLKKDMDTASLKEVLNRPVKTKPKIYRAINKAARLLRGGPR